MPRFKLDIGWTVETTIEVEAENESEAEKKANDLTLSQIKEKALNDPSYQDDSIQVYDGTIEEIE